VQADPRPDVHEQQRANHGYIADCIQQEAPAFADGCDYDPGHSRTDDPRSVQHRGVERDGVHDVSVVNHLDQKRLAGRYVERVGDSQQRCQQKDMPGLHVAA
jgi:hypothetical protein